MSGEIEDERHFVLNCSVYEDLRNKMFVTLRSTLSKQQQATLDIQKARKEEEGGMRLLAGLIGETFAADERLRNAVFKFCRRAMRRRNNLVRTVLDQMT